MSPGHPRFQGSFKEMWPLGSASESDGTGVKDTLRKGTEVGTQGLPGGLQRCGLAGAEVREQEAWEEAQVN